MICREAGHTLGYASRAMLDLRGFSLDAPFCARISCHQEGVLFRNVAKFIKVKDVSGCNIHPVQQAGSWSIHVHKRNNDVALNF